MSYDLVKHGAEQRVSIYYPLAAWQIDALLRETVDLPDDTPIECRFAPYQRRADGFYGPPSIPLGRLREELVLRIMFPHQAQTVVL